jgi:quercetin dioxygenase-like cupin family protein
LPIIKHGDGSIEEGTPPGVEVRNLVNAAQGSESLNVGVVTVYPSTRVPRHIHANTEQAVVVLEGKLTVILGKARHALGVGDVALIPAGGTHGYVNATAEPARILVVYPTHHVEQVLTSIEHSSGYQSEAGLVGNLRADGSYTGGTR